jgi:RimJ/RimL family protein N-acetyltransferase
MCKISAILFWQIWGFDMYIKRVNPYNQNHLLFLYETRFNKDVTKTLLESEKPTFEKHVEYVKKKDASGHLFFICYKEDVPIGYCQCFSLGSDVWELGWVIHPEYQNLGYGKLSVQLLLLEVFAMGGSAAELVVLKANYKAFAIYVRFGFQVIEESKDSYRMRLKPIINSGIS